jgi:S1-C subfamily serine protease
VGDTVKVEVVRGGNRQTLEATLVSDANAGQ